VLGVEVNGIDLVAAHEDVTISWRDEPIRAGFGSVGDSIIAEFASPVEALRCAVEIQQEIEARSASLPEDRHMRFRIGVKPLARRAAVIAAGTVILDSIDAFSGLSMKATIHPDRPP
jgi:class 3 adenylate cyclase